MIGRTCVTRDSPGIITISLQWRLRQADRPGIVHAPGALGGFGRVCRRPWDARWHSHRGKQAFGRNPKPFIAAVNGLAIGAGIEQVRDRDIRIASTEAYSELFEG